MNYAMLGPGAPSHVLADRLQRAAKFEWQDIAFRGGTPAVQALMSNDVQGYFATQSFAMTFKDSDKLKLMGIGADERGDVPARRADLQGDGLRRRRRTGLVRDVRALEHAEADHRQAPHGVRRGR